MRVAQKRYPRMTKQQFSAALDEVRLTPEEFSWGTGSNEVRVNRWLKGEEDIPPWVTVLCAVLTLPGARGMFVNVARQFSPVPPPPPDRGL